MKVTRQTILAGLIRRNHWTQGAELGVWQGQTFGYLLREFPDLWLVGVDRWLPLGPYEGKDMVDAREQVRVMQRTYEPRARILRMETVEAAAYVSDRILDFVFIDASHDQASVSADIAAWRGKVREGGMILGHDLNLEDVRAAVSRSFKTWIDLGANVWGHVIR